MATWMTHFRVADRFIDTIEAEKLDVPCFVFGNIAPDCGVLNADGLSYTPGKDISHFGHTDDRDYDSFLNAYLNSCEDSRKKSFYLGYYLHLLTDDLWVRKAFRPQQKKYSSDFADRKSFSWAMKGDWYDLDKLFLKKNPDFRAFGIFAGIRSFPNDYVDFFPGNTFDLQLERIKNFYLAPADNVDREYKYFSEAEMNDFVASADSLRPIFSAHLNSEYVLEYADSFIK